LDEQEFDHTLAADLHVANVEVDTPYGDLGHMAQKQAAAFLPDDDDDGSFGEDLIDNAGLFPDAPEADAPEAGLFGENSGGMHSPVGKIAAFHSSFERLEPRMTPKAARRHIKKQMRAESKKGKDALSTSNHSIGKRNGTENPDEVAGTYGDRGGMSVKQATSLLPDHSISDLRDLTLCLGGSVNANEMGESEGSDGMHSSVGKVAAFHSSFERPKAARRHIKKQMRVGSRKVKDALSNSNHGTGKRNGTENPDEVAGTYGDRGGMSVKQATSFLPDHSISDLRDLTLCLGGSVNANEMGESEGSGGMHSSVGKVAAFHSSFERPKAARRHIKKQTRVGSKKVKDALSPSNHSTGKRNGIENPDEEAGTYGDLGGMSVKQATSFLPDHSISDLGDLSLCRGAGGSANKNEMDEFLENSVFGIGN
jgi:hypothetical protein